MLTILQQIKRNGVFVSRDRNKSIWHYRSLEITIHYEYGDVIKITGKNRRNVDVSKV